MPVLGLLPLAWRALVGRMQEAEKTKLFTQRMWKLSKMHVSSTPFKAYYLELNLRQCGTEQQILSKKIYRMGAKVGKISNLIEF